MSIKMPKNISKLSSDTNIYTLVKYSNFCDQIKNEQFLCKLLRKTSSYYITIIPIFSSNHKVIQRKFCKIFHMSSKGQNILSSLSKKKKKSHCTASPELITKELASL